MQISSNDIICDHYNLIIEHARKLMDEEVEAIYTGLHFILESHGFDYRDIYLSETYFKDRFQGKQLDFILNKLKEIKDIEERFQDLYYSIKNIAYKEKGYLI